MSRGENCLRTLLYHYTCRDHGAPGIVRTRELVPRRHPLLGLRLIWLTDLPRPDRYALGLTASYLDCDRTEIRVSVAMSPDIERWGLYAHRHDVPRVLRDAVELDSFPAHWWVADRALPVENIESMRAAGSVSV